MMNSEFKMMNSVFKMMELNAKTTYGDFEHVCTTENMGYLLRNAMSMPPVGILY